MRDPLVRRGSSRTAVQTSVVRIARRWPSGNLRCAMGTSKSSSRQSLPRADPESSLPRRRRAAGAPTPRGRLVTRHGAGLELRPEVLRRFALQVPHLARHAARAERARQAFLRASPSRASSMIIRAAPFLQQTHKRTNRERASSASLRPPSTPSASRISARMEVFPPSGCSLTEVGRQTEPR
jgi:hypothetical protein